MLYRNWAMETMQETFQAMHIAELKEIIIETNLYSVYLFQDKDLKLSTERAVIVKHFSATQPSVDLLGVKVASSATRTERNQQIMEATEATLTQPLLPPIPLLRYTASIHQPFLSYATV
ncbi:hypothetical protein [Planococcus halotolerans]|nr:hypothetical protein [Planococcus halotolerans]